MAKMRHLNLKRLKEKVEVSKVQSRKTGKIFDTLKCIKDQLNSTTHPLVVERKCRSGVLSFAVP